LAKHEKGSSAIAIGGDPAEMFPEIVTSLPGPKGRAIIERDHAIMSTSYTRDYPFVMDRGEGAVVWDVDGNRFIDFAAGIAVCATGHSHPHVVAAITEQAGKFLHMSGTDYYYDVQPRLAERLSAYAPIEGSKRVFFTNSGTESVEGAIKLARYATGGHQMIAFFGAFHGRTLGALSLTASKNVQRKSFTPLMPGVVHVQYGEPVENIEAVIKRIVDTENFAALFVEPIQGEGGYLIPTAEWLQGLRDLCNRYGILMVADEVQSGMGRTGKMFALEHFGVKADVVCAAKGIASGMPLGAIIAKADIMDWKPGMHGTTFGGNPVCCAAAHATMDLLEQGVMDNARDVGAHMLERLQELRDEAAVIGDARGLGLMIAIDFVDADGKPAPDLRNRAVVEAFELGLLVLGCGTHSIRLCPPLVITREQADCAVDILKRVCAKLA
jgi:4-aminobutyrate aminotransferase